MSDIDGQQAFVAQLVGRIEGTPQAPLPIGVVGARGSGKSAIARRLHNAVTDAGRPSVLVDCGRFRTPWRVELVTEICEQLPGGDAALVKAGNSMWTESFGDRGHAFEALRQELRDLLTQVAPVLVVDSFDELPEGLRNWFWNELSFSGSTAQIVVFAGHESDIPRAELLSVPSITVEEVVAAASRLGVTCSSRDAAVILKLASGSGFRIPLLLSALAAGIPFADNVKQNLDDVFDAIVEALPESNVRFLRVVSEFVVHPDKRSLSVVFRSVGLPHDDALIPALLEAGYLTQTPEGEPLRINPELAAAVSRRVPRQRVIAAARAIDREAAARVVVGSGSDRVALSLVRLQYQFAVDQEAAIERLRDETRRAVRESNLDYANALITLGERERLSREGAARVAHCRARHSIAEYDAGAAGLALAGASAAAHHANDPEFLAEQLMLEAMCVVNPARLPHGDLFDAAKLLEEAKEYIAADSRLGGEIYQLLGVAYRSTGRSDKSIEAFELGRKAALAADDAEMALALVEQTVQSYRYIQDLPASRTALDAAFQLKGEHDIPTPTGVLDYYAANLLRDEDHSNEARTRYRAAQEKLALVGDESQLCCLLGDWAWLEFLEGNLTESRNLLEQSFTIAKRYGFRAEIAEYWHSRFHLAREAGQMDDAWKYISLGWTEAHSASNVYMILDCGMHTAEFHRDNGDLAGIKAILDEMEGLERRGCGIRVFRGRTQVVYANALFAQGELSASLDNYLAGLEAVAQFGNSRTNVDTFDDILTRYREELMELLVTYGPDGPKNEWANAGLADRFPQFLDLCDLAAQNLEAG